MKPKFKHNCDTCEYLGTYFNHDVYICKRESGSRLGPTVIARSSDVDSDYGSQLLKTFLSSIANNTTISIPHKDLSLKYREEYLFSEYCPDFTKAIATALMLNNRFKLADVDNGERQSVNFEKGQLREESNWTLSTNVKMEGWENKICNHSKEVEVLNDGGEKYDWCSWVQPKVVMASHVDGGTEVCADCIVEGTMLLQLGLTPE